MGAEEPAGGWPEWVPWEPPDADEEALIRRLNAEAAAAGGNPVTDDDRIAEDYPSSWEIDQERSAAFARGLVPDADELAGHENGPALAWRLGDVDGPGLDDYAAVELVAAWSRLVAWAQAGAAGAAAELAARPVMRVAPAPAADSVGRGGRRIPSVCAGAQEIGMRLMISRVSANG